MNSILRIITDIHSFSLKGVNRLFQVLYRSKFARIGKNVTFFPLKSFFTYDTISIANDVYIGPGACFSSVTNIIIGNKVLFGPNVTIMGGDHNTTQIGEYMFDVETKLPENDMPVIIGDDVWVGTGVIILKGVTIGTGSIIAAGSVVNKSILPYTINAGIPSRVVKNRFTDKQLEFHLKLITEKKQSNGYR